MNLSLILNMPAGNTPANPASAPAVQGQIPAEMASFQDFLSLMGLSPMPVGEGEEPTGDEAALADPAMLAAIMPDATGNILPPGLPVLPPVAAGLPDTASLAAGEPASGGRAPAASTMPASVPPQTLAQGLPLPTEAALATMAPPQQADQFISASLPQVRSAAQPQGTVQLDLVLPDTSQAQALPQTQPVVTATQQQAAAQPVLAQIMQAGLHTAPRKASDEPAVALAPVVAPAAAEADPAVPAPVPPVAPGAALVAVPADAAPAPVTQASAATPEAAASAERHDFTAVIDKLSEARELARPGRADMHLSHREFGQVSVQFELAGQALKVAMTSADPGFAPAVQQALADRPVSPVADAARTDAQAQRNDTVSASTASWQAGPQADGQRQDQGRAQQARNGQGPVRQNDSDADSGTGQAASRDGSRFA